MSEYNIKYYIDHYMLSIETIETKSICSWENQTVNVYKYQYSEVCTPFILADLLLSSLDRKNLSTFELKCLDAGCGSGNITFVLYKYIYEIWNIPKKRDYILNDVIHVIDVNKTRLDDLLCVLPLKNAIHKDFLDYDRFNYYDIVVSNPPFIIENKKTIWPDFFKRCVDVLKPNGILCIICPSIWMKPLHPMFSYITNFKIHRLTNMQNNEANELFGGDARTPMCYIMLEKCQSITKTIPIYDVYYKKYVAFSANSKPLPMYYPGFIDKLLYYVEKYGSLKNEIIKTNYYSNNPSTLYQKKKVVLANKMYGIPYYDTEGKYGISTRDNYVYVSEDNEKCKKIWKYLNCDFVFVVYETTRYRMGYLEKFAFEFIPNVLNMNINDADDINDIFIHKIFDLSQDDINCIKEHMNRVRVKRFNNV